MFSNLNKKSFLMSSVNPASSFGLEISDESLKFAELVMTKNGIKVGRYGEKSIPTGIIENGEIIEPVVFKNILSGLRKKEGLKYAHISLPDDQIHILKLKLDKKISKNIKQGIELALEYNIPMSAQVFIFDYKLLNEDTKAWEVQVVVIDKNIMESYVSVFEKAKIEVLSFESRAQAAARLIIKKNDLETHMIVDLAVNRTEASIVSSGAVMLDSVINADGLALTKNVHILREEISKHFLFWHTNKDQDGKVRPPIKKIILCGEGEDLSSLADYLSVSLKHQVEVANAWVNILNTEKHIPEMSFKQSLIFVVALGLALKGVK